MKKMGIVADATLNILGLHNAFPGDVEVEDEVATESGETGEEDLDALTAETKADIAAEVQEIQETDATDTVEDLDNTDGTDDTDDSTEDTVEDLDGDQPTNAVEDLDGGQPDTVEDLDKVKNTATDTDNTHPAAEPQQDTKGSDPMNDNNGNNGSNNKGAGATVAGISWAFINSAPEKIFKALTEQQLDPELGEVSLALIAAYAESFKADELMTALKSVLERRPDIIFDLMDWSDAFIDANTIPEYGIRYEGAVGNLAGKAFDSEKEARKAAEQALSCGMEFKDLFTFDFFYKNEKGELTERVPEGSKHRELIEKQLASSPQQSSTAAS